MSFMGLLKNILEINLRKLNLEYVSLVLLSQPWINKCDRTNKHVLHYITTYSNGHSTILCIKKEKLIINISSIRSFLF